MKRWQFRIIYHGFLSNFRPVYFPVNRFMSTHSKTSSVPSRSTRNNMIHFKLCVVRHGETPENKNNIFQGHIDTVLSEEGVRQSELAGGRLKNEKFTHAFSSDLQRAYTTAENILQRNKQSKDLVLIKDPRIREKAFGVFEGKPRKYVMEQVRKHNSTSMDYVPEGGESLPQLTERAVNFFDDLCKKIHDETTKDKIATGGTSAESDNNVAASANLEGCVSDPSDAHVLVVFHGGTIRYLFYHFFSNISSEFMGNGKKTIGKLCPNTGVSNFDVYVGKESGKAVFIKCTTLYDGSHLIDEDEKVLHEDRAL